MIGGTLLQSTWWGRVKQQVGWERVGTTPLVLRRRVGPFTIAYAPHAFGEDSDPSATIPVAEAVATLRRCEDTATLLRWDVPWSRDAIDRAEWISEGLHPAPVRIQPPDTVIVPLSSDENDLLTAMKSKTRYNVRLAAKRGVTVEKGTDAEALALLPRWYELYKETASRDRIGIHPYRYYETVLRTAVEMQRAGEPSPELSVYTAYHEGDLLAGIVVASWAGTSTYLYGASANKKRNLMASYLLQWSAMRDAAGAGDQRYDLFGIPPADDPNHPMHGLYRFKTGFGGEILRRGGAWDIPIHRATSGMYRRVEALRGWYHYRFRKR